MITINLKNRCSSKKSLALFMQTNITHLKELEQLAQVKPMRLRLIVL